MICISVHGIPVAKGSARAFLNKYTQKTMVVQTNAAKQKPWASMISIAAQTGMGAQPPLDSPVCVTMEFCMPRPKAHFGKSGLKGSVPFAHSSRPDIDKLQRLVLDALTGVVWKDDSQVSKIVCTKLYSTIPGVNIMVEYFDGR